MTVHKKPWLLVDGLKKLAKRHGATETPDEIEYLAWYLNEVKKSKTGKKKSIKLNL